jgi:hypothetical protein
MNQNQPVKLLLDECLGRPIVADMNKMLSWDSPTPTIHHLTYYFIPGTKDPDWIPKVKSEGWIILTQDKGEKGRDKLPQICAHYKITHIIMGKAVLHLKQNQKANAIISVWEQIKDCNSAPPGTRFRLRLNHAGKPVIEKVDLPPSV